LRRILSKFFLCRTIITAVNRRDAQNKLGALITIPMKRVFTTADDILAKAIIFHKYSTAKKLMSGSS
jgi:hypothetical protein